MDNNSTTAVTSSNPASSDSTMPPRRQISIDTKLLTLQRLESFVQDSGPFVTSDATTPSNNIEDARGRIAAKLKEFEAAFNNKAALK